MAKNKNTKRFVNIKSSVAKISKFLSIMCVLIPIFFSTTSCSVNSQKVDKIDENVKDIDLTSEHFFPKIFIFDYYDFIEFDNNAKPIISDKLVIKIIEDVISRVSSSKGEIKFSTEKYSNSAIDINFKWTLNGKTLFKTYSIYID